MKPRHSRRNRSKQRFPIPKNQYPPDDDLLFENDVDPSDFFAPQNRGQKMNRKARQLCGQVAETLSYVLGGECNDDVLRNLLVVAVDPAPDASQLAVTVCQDPPSDAVPPAEVLARLAAAAGKLRAAVATAITRKRAPKLLFRVLPVSPREVRP